MDMKKIVTLIFAVYMLSAASCGNGSRYKSPEEVHDEKMEAVTPADKISDIQTTESEGMKSQEEDAADTGIYYAMVRNDLPGVIDFNATWCAPCRQMTPVFHKLAKEFKGKYNFISIDVDIYPQIAEKYHIQSIPTFVFIDADGEEGYRINGAVPESELREQLENPAWF